MGVGVGRSPRAEDACMCHAHACAHAWKTLPGDTLGSSGPIAGTAGGAGVSPLLRYQHKPYDHLTPRRLMASLRSPTTLFPSAPEALKPLVQFRRMPWSEGKTEMGLGV